MFVKTIPPLIPPTPIRMTEGAWISNYCLHTEGFPKLLYATMQRLGIQERPEYERHEYEEHDTKRCEVTVYIAKSKDFPDIAEAWSTATTRFHFTNAYQAIARKSLVTPMLDLCRAHCPYTHEILFTPREEPPSLDRPHGNPTRIRR
jgi:hypothetical protein